jgi:hypothetical protein
MTRIYNHLFDEIVKYLPLHIQAILYFPKLYPDVKDFINCFNERNNIYNTYLFAIEYGYVDVVKFFREYCVDFDDLLDDNDIMYFACIHGHLEIIKYLHGCGADLDGDHISTAAEHGYLDIIKYLHKNKIGGYPYLALYHAARRGYFNIVKFLHENYEFDIEEAIKEAAERGHLDIAEWLRENEKPDKYRFFKCK